MDLKKIWKESFIFFLLKRIVLALLIFVALAWGALVFIDYYTAHGESETVPELKGLYVPEAELLLSNQGLYPKVIDSMFARDEKLGVILEQIPPAGSSVKKDRSIYLIINATQVRKVPVPPVKEISFRQAEAMINAVGLKVGSVRYLPSEYKGLVIGVQYEGEEIEAGLRLPEQTEVVLVVGSGLGKGETRVPYLKGFGLDEATRELLSDSLMVGAVNYDVLPKNNQDEYVIYKQQPDLGRSVSTGTRVNLWLTRDKSKLQEGYEEGKKKNTDNEEEFF